MSTGGSLEPGKLELIEQILVDIFKQHVIVPVIHTDSNQNRPWRFECLAQHRADFFRGMDHAATRAKGFGVQDDIHGPKSTPEVRLYLACS